MDNFLNRLNRNPYQPIDSASITRVDELGNGYDDWNNLIAPKFEAPEQTWGEAALGVATAPARMATALAGSLSPYGADGWQVPPIVNEGVNALTAVGDAYNYGMSDDEINSRALGMAGFMMGGGGLAAKSPVSRAANLFPDQPRAMSADLFAEAVPAGERFGARTAADPRQSKHWPSWGDREPDRAAAHVREQEAADAWFSIVDPIMYDERGLKRMERHEAEALAIERFPDALDKGFAYKEAAKAWNEIDKGRPMTAAEQAWFDLDLAPGRARTSRNEIMRDIVMPNMIMPDGSTGVQHMAAANGPKKLYSNASKESSIPAIASALDMSPEARLARAKEMAFDTDTTWSHYTAADPESFTRFDQGKIGENYGVHHGFHFTDDASIGQNYGPNRIDVYLRGPLKTIDLAEMEEIAQALGVDYPTSQRAMQEFDSKHYGHSPASFFDHYAAELEKLAQDKGLAGYSIIARNGGERQAVVFDPRNIRSVNAAFDPAKSDSANLLAANADSKPALLASALADRSAPASQGKWSPEATAARMRQKTAQRITHGADVDISALAEQAAKRFGASQLDEFPVVAANRYGADIWSGITHGLADLDASQAGATGQAVEGFLTNKGRFVSREDAQRLASKYGVNAKERYGLDTQDFNPEYRSSLSDDTLQKIREYMASKPDDLYSNADSRPALLASALGQDDIPDWLLPFLPPQ